MSIKALTGFSCIQTLTSQLQQATRPSIYPLVARSQGVVSGLRELCARELISTLSSQLVFDAKKEDVKAFLIAFRRFCGWDGDLRSFTLAFQKELGIIFLFSFSDMLVPFLEAGVDFDCEIEGRSLFKQICYLRDPALVELALEKGAKPAKDYLLQVFRYNRKFEEQDVEIAKILKSRGIDGLPVVSLLPSQREPVETKKELSLPASLSFKSEEKPITIPTYLEAFKVCWSLGDDWWMQLYDGRHIRPEWGPRVFDEGLHDGTKEPGFYENAKKACELASGPDYLMAPPAVKMYKDIHRIACRHFRGKSTSTLVGEDKIGRFRQASVDSSGDCSNFFTLPDIEEFKKEYKKYKAYLFYQALIEKYLHKTLEPKDREAFLVFFPELTAEEVIENYKKAKLLLGEIVSKAKEKMKWLNEYINARSKTLGLSESMGLMGITDDIFTLDYRCNSEDTLEKVVTVLFNEYNEKMEKAKTRRDRLYLIADLFQMLEWLHPFPDGQGRTDLILLMKELCRHGFTPAILDYPYVSTTCPLDEWVAYLERGMEKWQKLEAERRMSQAAAVKS